MNTYNKNWIYRGDDWLLPQRWEMLVSNRSTVSFAQVISWNDFGESHYVGPVLGIQPMSEGWVNGFDHQGWLDLLKYYVSAYKTGVYPVVTKDRVFLWARLYPVDATAPDPVGKPSNYQWVRPLATPTIYYLLMLTSLIDPGLPLGSDAALSSGGRDALVRSDIAEDSSARGRIEAEAETEYGLLSQGGRDEGNEHSGQLCASGVQLQHAAAVVQLQCVRGCISSLNLE